MTMETNEIDIGKAQNGDFLAYEYDEEDGGGVALLIFNQPYLPYEAFYHYHALLEKDGRVIVNGTCCFMPENFRRCTEEEKLTLLEKMEEDYWHWNDADKYVVSTYRPLNDDPSINSGKLNLWAKWQYEINVKKGWHKPEYETSHFLMMIVTELAEIVEADRKKQHARKNFYRVEAIKDSTDYQDAYDKYIKTSIEEEFADVCLRTIDLAYKLYGDTMEWNTTKNEFPKDWRVTRICWNITHKMLDEDRERLSDVIRTMYGWADQLHIDLNFHITAKLRYNQIALETKKYKRY